MDNDSDCSPVLWDPQRLLHEEVQILAKRVDALIKWTEEFEDQIIFFGKSGAGKKGEESSSSPSPKGGKSPIPKLVASKAEEDEERGGGKAEGNFQDAWSKLEDKQGNDDVIEEACEAQDESLASNGEIDLFGASTSFTEFKLDFTPQQAPHQPTNKVSLLEFD